MGLHPNFPVSPYAPLIPEQRWFPADETMRATAYEKLLPPLVSKVRKEVFAWRNKGYAGASATSVALLKWWFETEHLTEEADGTLRTFNYYFAQREAVETIIWLYESKLRQLLPMRAAWAFLELNPNPLADHLGEIEQVGIDGVQQAQNLVGGHGAVFLPCLGINREQVALPITCVLLRDCARRFRCWCLTAQLCGSAPEPDVIFL
jgi:hypothetical protein